MDAGMLAMSSVERERLVVVGQVAERRLSQAVAAERLGLGIRQVKRLLRLFRAKGVTVMWWTAPANGIAMCQCGSV